MPDYAVRRMRESDISGAVRLQRACFPPPFREELLWTAEHLSRHLDVFPEGQLVAMFDGEVIGSASNCIVSEQGWFTHGSWEETVGGPFIERHDPDGTTLYGLDVSVRPDWRGKGVMRALYRARFDLVKSLGLKRYGTAVRIPGYDLYQVKNAGASPDDYVQAVSSGTVFDRTLTPMLRVGLRLVGVIRNYMDDAESHDAAAVLEWQP
jgi:GNAT superfamily N-acetyltransferase